MDIISQSSHYQNGLRIKINRGVSLSTDILELSMSLLDGGLNQIVLTVKLAGQFNCCGPLVGVLGIHWSRVIKLNTRSPTLNIDVI